ncbi:MAG TPA: methylmalonyl-CoA epimerase [Firmicutes bacterium]|nr:methylmalonyl-CoA epimerase [Bacillota bacterium]
MVELIDHIGIAVPSLEPMIQVFKTGLGIEHCEIEEVGSQKVRTAIFTIGDTRIELLEPTAKESPIAKFIEERGVGIHHIAFRVRDIEEAISRVKQSGMRMIDEKPREGVHGSKIAFIHPKSFGGVLVELVKR